MVYFLLSAVYCLLSTVYYPLSTSLSSTIYCLSEGNHLGRPCFLLMLKTKGQGLVRLGFPVTTYDGSCLMGDECIVFTLSLCHTLIGHFTKDYITYMLNI